MQQKRTKTGRTIKWDREASPDGKRIDAALRSQRAKFIAKFGREPGPNDPIFFDPDAEEPTPMGAAAASDMWDVMMEAAERAGIDPALIHAGSELGYLVTDENRHLFSAMEIEAFRDAVLRYRGEPNDGDEDDQESETFEDDIDYVAHSLQLVVAEALLSDGNEQPALRFMDGVLNGLEHDDGGPTVGLVFGCLTHWLVSAKDSGVISADAVTWVNQHLSEDAAGAAVRASGFLGYPYAPDLTFNELHDELGPVAIAAMIWLARRCRRHHRRR